MQVPGRLLLVALCLLPYTAVNSLTDAAPTHPGPLVSTGLSSLISSVLNSSTAEATRSYLAGDLLGIVHAINNTPGINLPSLSVPFIPPQGAEDLRPDLAAGLGLGSSIQAGVSSTLQRILNILPANDTTLELPGQVTLGTEEKNNQGFSIPIIELSDGTQINPAALDLAQLQDLASDALSPFCSAAYFNASGIVPATWTFGTFSLTLSTGACGLAGTVGPDPSDPDGDWLASADFVCETPELSWEQEPTTFVDEYVAPATLITQSCKVAVNTTDGWVQTLYTGGNPVTFPSRASYLDAMINGSFTSIWTSPDDINVALLEQLVAPWASVIDQAAATAPPLVVSVKSGPLITG